MPNGHSFFLSGFLLFLFFFYSSSSSAELLALEGFARFALFLAADNLGSGAADVNTWNHMSMCESSRVYGPGCTLGS